MTRLFDLMASNVAGNTILETFPLGTFVSFGALLSNSFLENQKISIVWKYIMLQGIYHY